MLFGIATLAFLILIYAATAERLNRWSIRMQVIFVAGGLVLNSLGVLPLTPKFEGVKELTEITLALLLFADASTLNLRQVSRDAGLPARLLLIGLPLMLVLGALLAAGLFPAEGLAAAALLGAILAPTDAALGLPIFNNLNVPVRIRRALNVESGLNDGIATPLVVFFIALAVGEYEPQSHWLLSAATQIGLAALVGTLTGLGGGWLLGQTAHRKWTNEIWEQIAILGLGLASYFTSLAVGGNGFIAAFVAGIVFGAATRDHFAKPTELTENNGSFLSLLVWTIFGAILVPIALSGTTDLRPIGYAVLSLTVIRMISVALALKGARLRRDTVLLMGWFGPRGLASVVFTLLALLDFEEAQRSSDTLVVVATWTILLSVLAHGLSAGPLSSWYARRLAAAQAGQVTLEELPETGEA
jgi:NhaP-type Na+/H+ or K+/H+ antiporter